MLHKFYKTTLKNKLEVIAIPVNKGSNVITSNIYYMHAVIVNTFITMC